MYGYCVSKGGIQSNEGERKREEAGKRARRESGNQRREKRERERVAGGRYGVKV